MTKKKKQNLKDLPLREQIKPIFKERFLEMLGSEDEYIKFVDCILTPQRKSFRVNSCQVEDIKSFIDNLNSKGIKTSKIKWIDNAFFVDFDGESRCDLGNLFEHFLGRIYVQEATSMSPPELLEIPENLDDNFMVLDVAASPGSKTTQLADIMKHNGILIANELDYKRIGPLKINLERSGFSNIVITNLDGRRIDGEEIFDRILLDAPCSGSGVIRKSPKTIRMYNPKKLKGIANLQLQLFARSFELLKKGGIMTYSTCSIDPEENEFVVMKFLEKYPDAELMSAKLDGLILNNKLSEFKGNKITDEVRDRTIRIWPQDNDTNGFYVAKIKKK